MRTDIDIIMNNKQTNAATNSTATTKHDNNRPQGHNGTLLVKLIYD